MKENKPGLFVDFGGTLCRDRICNTLESSTFRRFERWLFGDSHNLLENWMRGKYTAEEASEYISSHTGISRKFLLSTVIRYSRRMHVPVSTLERLQRLRHKYSVVMITDNIDSFNRFTVPHLGLSNYFDMIINSYDEGMLKRENDGEIFIKTCSSIGSDIENCTLIDDSPNICSIFSGLGGKSFLIESGKDIEYYLSTMN